MRNALKAVATVAVLLSTAATAQATPTLDIVFGMDSSGSLGSSGWAQEQDFVDALISTGLPANTKVGVVEFSTGASEKIPLTLIGGGASSLISQINALPYEAGSTYTKDAVQAAIDVFDNESAAGDLKLFLLLTDGVPNPPTAQSPCNLTTTLASKDIKTVVVGAGAGFSASPVKCLVDNTATDIIPIADFSSSDLSAILASIQAAATPTPEPAGWSLLLLGVGAMLYRRRKAKRAAVYAIA